MICSSLDLENHIVVVALEGVPMVAAEYLVVGAVCVAPGTSDSPDASKYMCVETTEVFPSLVLLSGHVFPLSNAF